MITTVFRLITGRHDLNTETDKFAAIRELCDMWVEILPMLYNHEMYFLWMSHYYLSEEKCSFRQYISQKQQSTVKNVVYFVTTQPVIPGIYSRILESILVLHREKPRFRLIVYLVQDLKGCNVTCDKFFTSYDF